MGLEHNFLQFVNIRLPYGLMFFGYAEVKFFILDPEGWWIEAVSDRQEKLPQDWAHCIRVAIDADTEICSEITRKCVQKARKIMNT